MDMTGYYYKCSNGETFDSAALQIYGHERYAAELMSANPEEIDKIVFDGGELLRIPDIDIPDPESDEAEALPVTAPWRE